MRLINLIGDRWVRNEALEAQGIITYRWGAVPAERDYTANVRIWPDRECVGVNLWLTEEELADERREMLAPET